MSIRDWPDQERPREKLISLGAEALSDAELLAIFLRIGSRGKSAVDLGREMLSHFDGLRGVMEANCKEFCQLPGLGETKYTQLHAVMEMARRYLRSEVDRGDIFDSPDATKDYLKLKFQHLSYEAFSCFFLDSQHQVIKFEKLFRGTIDSASVYPRDVVKRCLELDSKAVIFVHNHPSGVAEPSRADISLTKHLQQALDLFEIRVLDHFVIGDDEPVSFSKRGLL